MTPKRNAQGESWCIFLGRYLRVNEELGPDLTCFREQVSGINEVRNWARR